MINVHLFGKRMADHRAIKDPAHHQQHAFHHEASADSAKMVADNFHTQAKAAESSEKYALAKSHSDASNEAFKKSMDHRAWHNFHSKIHNKLTGHND